MQDADATPGEDSGVERAIALYRARVDASDIAAEFGRSKAWVYNAVTRHIPKDERALIERENRRRGRDRLHAGRRAELLANLPPCGCPGCDDPQCEIKPWQCHRRGCAERVKAAESTKPKQRLVAGHPRLYCKPGCVPHDEAARKRSEATARAVLEEYGVGACGCVGCKPDCDVEPGHCHRAGCDEPTHEAKETRRSDRTVRGYPPRYHSQRCSGLASNPEALAKAIAQVRRKADRVAGELLAQAGGCGSPACRDLDCPIPPGQCHQPGCTEPAGTAPQTQRHLRWVVGHPTRFCALHGFQWIGRALADNRARGLLSVTEAADRLCVSPRAIGYYMSVRLIEPDETSPEGMLWFTERTVNAFQRRWVSSGDGRRARMMDPDSFVDLMSARGLVAGGAISQERERVKRRRREFLKHRAGRKRAPAPAPHHLRLLSAFEELRDYYERQHCAGEPMPSDWQLFSEIAREDQIDHPEQWSYDPASMPREAAARVRKAIKSAGKRANQNHAS